MAPQDAFKLERFVTAQAESGAEARAYHAHPVLAARLLEGKRTLDALQGRSALQVFGATDALEFCASMIQSDAGGSGPPRRRAERKPGENTQPKGAAQAGAAQRVSYLRCLPLSH